MPTTTLAELLVEELRDLYSAESQLTKALPRLSAAACDEGLKSGFSRHLAQTREHLARLDRVLELLDASPKGKACQAMKGLIAEGEQKVKEDASAAIRDAALIAAAQKVEHYEIAGYGTVRTYAELLGEDEIVSLLQKTLDEETDTDRQLTKLASALNVKAETSGEMGEAARQDGSRERSSARDA